MAKHPPIIISGHMGNLIFYNRLGTPCVRTKPKRVRQTKATKASAKQFGSAVRMSGMLRETIQPVLSGLKGPKPIFRWRTAVYQWLTYDKPGKNTVSTDLYSINGFEFNPQSELSARLKVKLSVDWTKPNQVILTIPSLDPVRDIAAPASTETVHWTIMAANATVEERSSATAVGKFEMDMPYNNGPRDAQQIKLPVAATQGEITVVAISLRYTTLRKGKKQLVTEERWLPTGIVAACCGKQG